jgi:hypothetical protein
MSVRLGEALIQKRLIDNNQLARALEVQLIYGGHLGTCLVELGLIDVDCLARVLGEKFQIKHADRGLLDKLEQKVLDSLPRKLVERHQVIPFALRERVLHVAMIEPKNLIALDELSFVSGFRIEVWVAPEVLVIRAMERYYKIPRKIRHIPVAGNRPSHVPQRATPQNQPATPQSQTQVPQTQAAADPSRSIEELRAELLQLASKTPSESSPPSPPSVAEQEPVVSEPCFVAQQVPRVAEAMGQHDQKIGWMKQNKSGTPVWCDLFDVPVEHDQFNAEQGVYVIWHHGQNPVLRVGHGSIRERLVAERRNHDLIELHEQGPVFVTWGSVSTDSQDGVTRYLIDMLEPKRILDDPEATPIEVNLPR